MGGNLANTVQGIDLSGTSSKLTKGLSEFQQTVKESIGRTDEDGVTELPEGRFPAVDLSVESGGSSVGPPLSKAATDLLVFGHRYLLRYIEYKVLERRCDALRDAHQSLLRVAKVYSTEAYDYPTNINESLGEIGSNVSHSLTFWASQATKNTALPKIEPTAKVTEQKKTLPHALSRAAAGGEYPHQRQLFAHANANYLQPPLI